MLWILPQCWNSWCMRLITHLYFLQRLQISAVVTVLPLYVFMVYTGITLPFTTVLEEWLQYLRVFYSVPQKMRAVCSHGTVCHCTVLCSVKTHTVVIWSVSNMGFWQHLCMCLFLLCNAHLLFLSLSFPFALLLSHLLFGLMIWKIPHCVFKIFVCVTCFDPYWPWHLASPKMGTCLCFLQELQFRILPCTVDHILFTDEKKDQTQLKLSQKLCVKNALYLSPYTDIIWYLYLSSYLIHFYQPVNSHVR